MLKSNIQTGSAEFKKNKDYHRGLIQNLRDIEAQAEQGGGPEARKRHEDRGKLLVRDRVKALLDPGSAFLEVGKLAAHGMYDGDAPAAGIVTGIGTVQGRECHDRGQRRHRQRRHLLSR